MLLGSRMAWRVACLLIVARDFVIITPTETVIRADDATWDAGFERRSCRTKLGPSSFLSPSLVRLG